MQKEKKEDINILYLQIDNFIYDSQGKDVIKSKGRYILTRENGAKAHKFPNQAKFSVSWCILVF